MTTSRLTFQRAALSLLMGTCVLLLPGCGDKKSKPDATAAAAPEEKVGLA